MLFMVQFATCTMKSFWSLRPASPWPSTDLTATPSLFVSIYLKIINKAQVRLLDRALVLQCLSSGMFYRLLGMSYTSLFSVSTAMAFMNLICLTCWCFFFFVTVLVNVSDSRQISCTLFGAGIKDPSLDERLATVMMRYRITTRTHHFSLQSRDLT